MSSVTRLTHFGHSCVLVELRSSTSRTKLLLDPGSLTPDLQPVEDLDALLITHAHPDHLDVEQIRRLRKGTPVPVIGDRETAASLAKSGITESVRIVQSGDRLAGRSVEVSRWPHEEIFPGFPLPENLGYMIGGSVFAPGDAFGVPDRQVDVLLLPMGGPWMKLSETIDYVRTVRPRVAVLVHDAGLATPHKEMHSALIARYAPAHTTVTRLPLGQPTVL